MIRSMLGHLKASMIFTAATVTATGTSSTVDMQGYHGLMLLLMVGVFNFASADKLVIDVEESVDGTVWTKVADADLIAVEAATIHRALDSSASDASTITRFDYIGAKRYVHLLWTETGTVSVPMAVAAVQSHPHLKPPL